MKVFYLFLFLMLAHFYSCQSQATNKSISPTTFIQQVKSSSNPIILDVRTPEEYKAGHIHNAINIDYYDDEFKSSVAKLRKERNYYIYCETGGRSASAAKFMRKEGFIHVVEIDGGIRAWVDAKLPTVMD